MRAVPAQEPMSCKELVEVITDYLEGALSTADRARFEEHLAECPHCVNYLEQMRASVRTLGRLTEGSIPSEARQELLRVFRGWKQGR